MQKLYRLVQAITFAVLFIIQHSLQAQNCCLDCQGDVKAITNNKVLLEKIDLKEGTSTTLNTNLYVSYRSGNAQKFWANLAIATAGLAVSTQLNSTPITAGDSKTQSAVSPIIPLGVSVATLPAIWKNRPRGVPNASIEIQHKDVEGNVLKTWTQAISKSARNDAELLNVALNEPLSKGTVEISLVNESKNSVYYWGYEGIKQVIENQNSILKTPDMLNLPTNNEPKVALKQADSKGVFSLSYSLPKKGDDIYSLLKLPKKPIWWTNPISCPDGMHDNGRGECNPNEVDGGELEGVTVTATPITPPTLLPIPSSPWETGGVDLSNPNGTYDNPGGGGTNGGNNNDPNGDPVKKQRIKECQDRVVQDRQKDYNNCNGAALSDLFTFGLGGLVGGGASGAGAGAMMGGTAGTFFIPGLGTVTGATAGGIIGGINGASFGASIGVYVAVTRYFLCTNNADITYSQNISNCK
jgi:hypothetical protein